MTKLHLTFTLLIVFLSVFATAPAYAHCDTIFGPVVRAARRALDTDDASHALRWVRPEDEAEVTRAFTSARRVRAIKPDAKESANRHFFETVVRLHRLGEGEPYTGLKDSAPEPALAETDKSLETGDVSPLVHGVAGPRANEIRERFARVQLASKRADDSLTAGREYVRAYIEFIHDLAANEGQADHARPKPAGPQQPFTPDGTAGTIVVIDNFSAAKTRLRKKEEAKLTLTFRSEPGGEHIAWRVACSGVAITGWDAPQLLSVSERTDAGDIQAIDARDYIVNERPVVIVVKRSKTSAIGQARCTLSAGKEEKTVSFQLR